MKSADVMVNSKDEAVPVELNAGGIGSTIVSNVSVSDGVAVRTLSEVPIGERFIVKSLENFGGAPEWMQQLEDIGFIAGEPVTLMARGAFGGDPLVVRIGLSTFALRKAEAACVFVAPEAVCLKAAA